MGQNRVHRFAVKRLDQPCRHDDRRLSPASPGERCHPTRGNAHLGVVRKPSCAAISSARASSGAGTRAQHEESMEPIDPQQHQAAERRCRPATRNQAAGARRSNQTVRRTQPIVGSKQATRCRAAARPTPRRRLLASVAGCASAAGPGVEGNGMALSSAMATSSSDVAAGSSPDGCSQGACHGNEQESGGVTNFKSTASQAMRSEVWIAQFRRQEHDARQQSGKSSIDEPGCHESFHCPILQPR